MGFKRVLATVLAATVLFSSVPVSAAFSPSDYKGNSYTDSANTEYHSETIVTSVITEKGATVEKVERKDDSTKPSVTIAVAKGKKGETVPVVAIKSNTPFDESLEKLIIDSDETVEMKAKALAKSQIRKIFVNGESAKFIKNSLKGSKVKKIYISTKTAATKLTVSSGVGTKVKVYLKKSVWKKLSSSQKKAYKKKVKRLSGSSKVRFY